MLTVVTRQSPTFKKMKDEEKKFQRNPQLSYNELAEQYNRMEVEEMIYWPRSPLTLYSVKKRLENRGLSSSDYLLYAYEPFQVDENGDPILDSNTGQPLKAGFLAVLVRKSSTPMKIIERTKK